MHPWTDWIAFVMAAGVAGCGGMTKAEIDATRSPVPADLPAQAARDLECAPSGVLVEGREFWMAQVSGGRPTHHAVGCGREALYDCLTPCRLVAVRPVSPAATATPPKSSMSSR